MRVLITGNLGFVGPLVVAKLKDKRIETVGLDTGWYLPTFDSERALHSLPDAQLFADLRDLGTFSLPSKIDVVIHLAGLSNDPLSEIDNTATRRINFFGTARLIHHYPLARHVVASSASVYGATPHGESSKETDTPNPLTAYAQGKIDIDKHLLDADKTESEFNWMSLRFGTLWGFSPNIRRDLVVNAFCWQAAKSREIAPAQNARRPLLHVEDAADMLVAAAVTNYRGVVNCAAENTTVLEIAEKVARATDSSLVPCPESNLDARDYWLDTARMYETIGDGHTFITLNDQKAIDKVYQEAKRRGDAYPTRIQRIKEVMEHYGKL